MVLTSETEDEEDSVSFEEFSVPLVTGGGVGVFVAVAVDVAVRACLFEFGSCGVGEGVLSLFLESCL